MQKQQTITNRHKKASDGQTSKASFLKVVPDKRNTSMNNSTAVNLNNQVWPVAYEAERVGNIVSKSVAAIKSIKNVLEFNQRNQDDGEDSLSGSVLEGLFTALDLIADNLKENIGSLNETLVKGGFAHE